MSDPGSAHSSAAVIAVIAVGKMAGGYTVAAVVDVANRAKLLQALSARVLEKSRSRSASDPHRSPATHSLDLLGEQRHVGASCRLGLQFYGGFRAVPMQPKSAAATILHQASRRGCRRDD